LAQAQTSPGNPSKAPTPGRPVSSILLFAGAGCLLLIAAIHAAGYAAVALAVRNSGLTPWFHGAFRALWLGYSLQLAVIAAILAAAGWKPGSVSKAVTILCGLLPLPSGLLLAHANDSLVTTIAFLLAAVLIVGGAIALPPLSPKPEPAPRESAGPRGAQAS
jgi:hypothetical protein